MHLLAKLLTLVLFMPAPASAEPAGRAGEAASLLQTPESIHEEHQEIHAILGRAASEPGAVGEAAKELAAVLEPHFRREEEIATPPLGLLAPLSNGPVTAEMRRVLPMTAALERELPQMLQEHRLIGAARTRFEAAARSANRPDYVRLAEALARHARQEEEILYPAAILVGRYVGNAGSTPEERKVP